MRSGWRPKIRAEFQYFARRRHYEKWTRTRSLAALCTLAGLCLPLVGTVISSSPAGADTSPYALVSVAGSSLAGVTASSPYALSPAFSPNTNDYVIDCASGTNQVTFTLTGNGGVVTAFSNQQSSSVSGNSVSLTLQLVPNRAVVIYAPDPASTTNAPVQYWIRCLPPGFPALQINATGPSNPEWTPGYYFTGNITSADSAFYAMVLNGNGTPVWYQALPSNAGGVINVQPLATDVISWANNNGYTGFDLETQSAIASLPAATSPTDPHELLPLPNGDRMMISTPSTSKDLTSLGTGIIQNSTTPTSASAANNTIADCEVEEVSPQNTAVWTWDASQHLGLDETNTVSGLPYAGPAWSLETVNNSPVADIYHCNSVAVDEDPLSSYYGDVLVSMRHLNAVFLIDKSTGDVIWKMGGTVLNSGDPEEAQATPAQYIALTGDSETTFCGQHDARFVATPNPAVEDVSLYDDHTQCTGAARGVEYAIDTAAANATPNFQYAQQQGFSVMATGSFRRMPDAANNIGSGTGLICWGFSTAHFLSGYTEVDSSGNVLVDVRFPNGEVPYRTIKVLSSDVNLNLLRQTAGWTGSTIPPPPVSPTVTSVVPTTGPSGGNTQATITGSGFTGARVVWFGKRQTQSFTVESDSEIIVQVPPGAPGAMNVRVTTDAGTSAASSGDAYTYGAETQQPTIVSVARTPDGGGYWIVVADGRVYNYGDAGNFGSAYGLALKGQIVGIAATPTGNGYWLVASDGGVFGYGDAAFYGSAGGLTLNKPVVGMAATPSGHGYWLVASDGGIFSYGDAPFKGSTGGMYLNKPVVDMAPTPSGFGYWLVASDGGVFSYGDASFHGSTGGTPLNKPVVGMAPTPSGLGYWLVASDGGVFSYGNAPFEGSTGSLSLNRPVVGMAPTPSGLGYWLVASDGGVFAYGNAPFEGSVPGG